MSIAEEAGSRPARPPTDTIPVLRLDAVQFYNVPCQHTHGLLSVGFNGTTLISKQYRDRPRATKSQSGNLNQWFYDPFAAMNVYATMGFELETTVDQWRHIADFRVKLYNFLPQTGLDAVRNSDSSQWILHKFKRPRFVNHVNLTACGYLGVV